MEQQLINALMKLLAKAGGGHLIKELIQNVEENRNPKIWTPEEISHAIDFVNQQIENFNQREAFLIIRSLVKKYNVNFEDFKKQDFIIDPSDEIPTSGVKGLQ